MLPDKCWGRMLSYQYSARCHGQETILAASWVDRTLPAAFSSTPLATDNTTRIANTEYPCLRVTARILGNTARSKRNTTSQTCILRCNRNTVAVNRRMDSYQNIASVPNVHAVGRKRSGVFCKYNPAICPGAPRIDTQYRYCSCTLWPANHA